MNRLYYGDNLDVLRDREAFPSESVDLVYLDPPFNSNANYNIILCQVVQIRLCSTIHRHPRAGGDPSPQCPG